MTRYRTVSMLAIVTMTAILLAAPARADVIYWNGAVDTNWTALAPGSNWDQGHDPSNCDLCSSQDVRVTNEFNAGNASQTIKYNAAGATIDDTPFPAHNSVLVSGFGAGKSMTINHSDPLGLFFNFQPPSPVIGTLSVGGEGGTGIYNQSGGFVNPVFLILGGGTGGRGTYNLTAVGSDPNFPTILPNTGLAVTSDINAGTDAGAKGTINQTGSNSRLFAQNSLTLGTATGGEGRYRMEDGLANVNLLAVGGAGTGHVLQTGGLINANGVTIGRDSGGAGTYDLNGGTLSLATGTLTVKGDAGATGTFNLNGGTLNSNGLINNDTFLFKQGAYNVPSTINNANFTVGGPGAVSPLTVNIAGGGFLNQGTGTLTVSGVTATFIGTVQNGDLGVGGDKAKVLVTNSNVTWQGVFVNYGEYRSDPSTQKFMGNLVFGATGYLVGGAGDVFEVHKDFINTSTKNTLWDTGRATLRFADNVAHDLYLSGFNKGQDPVGLFENFAWGEVELGQGAGTLYLNPFSYNGGPLLPALYTSFFDIFVDLNQNLANTIMDRVDGVWDIFYDNHNHQNDYLNSLTYAFGEGGSLRPIYVDALPPGVPEPATLMLLTGGLAGLLLIRRRRLDRPVV